MFEGKTICGHCQTPQPPESFREGSEVCLVCERKLDLKLARVEAKSQTNSDVLTESLQELRQKEAATPSAAEAFLSKINGPQGFGNRLADDFMSIRGEDLTEDQKNAHVVDQSHLLGFYKIASNLMEARDKQVADSDPITDMDSEELNAIVADGAMLRIQADDVFREQILRQIIDADPALVERVITESPLPAVEVVHG